MPRFFAPVLLDFFVLSDPFSKKKKKRTLKKNWSPQDPKNHDRFALNPTWKRRAYNHLLSEKGRLARVRIRSRVHPWWLHRGWWRADPNNIPYRRWRFFFSRFTAIVTASFLSLGSCQCCKCYPLPCACSPGCWGVIYEGRNKHWVFFPYGWVHSDKRKSLKEKLLHHLLIFEMIEVLWHLCTNGKQILYIWAQKTNTSIESWMAKDT